MSTPLLATKLYLPHPRLKAVRRPRLIERLNAGLHGKLTLISAPAGFGKTTLVSEWIAGRGRPAAWLSLDAGDRDPARFLAYLVAALQTLDQAAVAPPIGAGVLAALQAPQPPQEPAGYEALLTLLLNEISTRPAPFVLVLDDYHALDTAPNGHPPLGAVDQAVTFLLDHLPPQMHLVITTREDPPLPLARLRARDQMTEVRAADLRFTATEAAGFLNEVMALDLAADDVAALETRTEGWIAGLQLAALSLQGRAQGTTDVAGFVRAFAGDNRYIVDYLVEEVLQHQPERVRRFLHQTAILDRLSGPLCDAVTGENDGRLLLDALERGNLFVVPLDDNRHWFRYHHLFADVLATHAQHEQPAQVPLLHQRASAWYAANGLPADAIRHALAAKDFARAADLLELTWPAMDGSFQTATWLSWARALPAEVIRTRPVLRVTYAWALLNAGELAAAEARLIEVEQWLEAGADAGATPGAEPSAQRQTPAPGMIIADDAQFQTLPASIATARAYLAQSHGHLPDTVKYGQRALDFLPATDHLRRGPAAALLGLAQWASGDLDAAYHTLAAAMSGFQKVGNLHFATSVTSGLADIRTVQGRLQDAIRSYTQALTLALAHHPEGTRPLIRGTANLYLGLSELYHEQDQREIAIEHLRRAEELGDAAGLPDWRYRFCRAQARVKEIQGDSAGALHLLDAAERHFRSTPVPEARPLAALRARLWLAQGRLVEALRWVQEQGLSVDDELSFLREFDHITLARVLLAQATSAPADRTIDEALRLLDRLAQAAVAGGRMGSVIEIGVLQALAHQAQGNLPSALVALQRALTLAEPEGYVRLFVDEGVPMAVLLNEAAKHSVAPAYVRQLRAALGQVEASIAVTQDLFAARAPTIPAQTFAIEPLSERELEVLRLLGTELAGPEIARRLMVSLNTMRTHTKNIFSKLGVNNRRAAVRRAEELDLV